MIKEDFKDIFNPVFMETVNMIIDLNKHDVFCHLVEHRCGSCPFSIDNTGGFCRSLGYSDILNRAKAFKKMVEEEKEKLNFKETNNLTKEIIENTDKKLKRVPFTVGTGHFFIVGNTTKGQDKRFEREYLQMWLDGKQIEKEEEKMQEFKVGDKVKVNDPKNRMRLKRYLHGQIGEITPLGSGEIETFNTYYVKIDDTLWELGKEYLEKIEEKPKFLVNKEVIFTHNPYEKTPRERKGIIFNDMQSNGKFYYVKLIDTKGLEWNMNANAPFIAPKEWIKKIEENPQQEPFELKEGVKVKIVSEKPIHKNFIPEMGEFLGKELTIEKRIYEKFGYKVKESWCFFNDEFIDWEATRKLNEVKEEPKLDKKSYEDLEKFVIDLIEDKVIKTVVLKEYGIKNPAKVKKITNRGYMDFEKPLDCSIVTNGKSFLFGCGVSYLDLEKTLEINGIQYVKKEPKVEIKEEPKQELYVIWNTANRNPMHKHTTFEDAEKEAERLAIANPNQEFYVLKAINKCKGQVKIEWEK